VAGHIIAPSKPVDQVWHTHMTVTHSYWDDFCKKVLEVPLHHFPMEGGPKERRLYFGLYNQTLASYRLVFEEAAPADIWPDAQAQFGQVPEFSD